MSPKPLAELVAPDWATALQPVSGQIAAMGTSFAPRPPPAAATCHRATACSAPSRRRSPACGC